MREHVNRMALASQQVAVALLSIFGALALALAAIGLYGVMSYAVSQSTRELGLRMALGAQQKDILRMALGEGMSLVTVGLVCGFVGALILTRLLRTLLYNVTPSDPFTFATIAAITEPKGAPRLIGYGCGGSSPFSLSSLSFSPLSPRRPTVGHAALTDVRQKLSSIVFVPGVA